MSKKLNESNASHPTVTKNGLLNASYRYHLRRPRPQPQERKNNNNNNANGMHNGKLDRMVANGQYHVERLMVSNEKNVLTEEKEKNGNSIVYKRNLLITGGAGFIGSHITVHFVKNYPEWRIVMVDKLTQCASLNNLKEIATNSKGTHAYENFIFIKEDICNLHKMENIFIEYQIDTVLHIAAETHVDYSFGNPLDFTHVNMGGTHVLLECARKQWQSKRQFQLFLYMSTDEVYGESQLITEKGEEETSLLKPTNPYSASKAGADLLVQSYYHSFQLPIIIARANNTYGPKQYPEKIIPKFITLLQRNKPLCIYGTGENLRCYLYVEDLVNAYDTLLKKGVIGEIYNIGNNQEYTNNQVSQYLCRILNKDPKEYMQYVKDRPKNDLRYLINCDKINALGWKPTVKFEDGLKLTVEWYEKHTTHWSEVDDALKPTPHQNTRKRRRKRKTSKNPNKTQ